VRGRGGTSSNVCNIVHAERTHHNQRIGCGLVPGAAS
jgi:hypothetical protein